MKKFNKFSLAALLAAGVLVFGLASCDTGNDKYVDENPTTWASLGADASGDTAKWTFAEDKASIGTAEVSIEGKTIAPDVDGKSTLVGGNGLGAKYVAPTGTATEAMGASTGRIQASNKTASLETPGNGAMLKLTTPAATNITVRAAGAGAATAARILMITDASDTPLVYKDNLASGNVFVFHVQGAPAGEYHIYYNGSTIYEIDCTGTKVAQPGAYASNDDILLVSGKYEANDVKDENNNNVACVLPSENTDKSKWDATKYGAWTSVRGGTTYYAWDEIKYIHFYDVAPYYDGEKHDDKAWAEYLVSKELLGKDAYKTVKDDEVALKTLIATTNQSTEVNTAIYNTDEAALLKTLYGEKAYNLDNPETLQIVKAGDNKTTFNIYPIYKEETIEGLVGTTLLALFEKDATNGEWCKNITNSATWSSSNPDVATVKAGIVTAVAEGTATITARCGKFYKKCTVNVTAPKHTIVTTFNSENIPAASTKCPVDDWNETDAAKKIQSMKVSGLADALVTIEENAFAKVTLADALADSTDKETNTSKGVGIGIQFKDSLGNNATAGTKFVSFTFKVKPAEGKSPKLDGVTGLLNCGKGENVVMAQVYISGEKKGYGLNISKNNLVAYNNIGTNSSSPANGYGKFGEPVAINGETEITVTYEIPTPVKKASKEISMQIQDIGLTFTE